MLSRFKEWFFKDTLRIQPVRLLVQFGFLAVTLWIGIEFVSFVAQLERGQIPTVTRPGGVEAFLPIASLMSLKHWVLTGVFNRIHPAGLVILLIILTMGLFLKKAFCSWVCPIGLFSEYLAKMHKLIFDRPRNLPRWLDYPLRSLKYLLLLFFFWAIFIEMNVAQLENFLYSPYNRVADIKMMKFFSEMSPLTARVLIGLVLMSILVRFFWCRYLCPYGALLGALSWLSPFKIHRNASSCIDCKKCTKVCPANIQVHSARAVFSDECHACLQCVDACPVKDTLYFSISHKRGRMARPILAALVVLLFLGGTSLAKRLGFWQTQISVKEYQYHIRHLDEPQYFHNRGETAEWDKNFDFENPPESTK